jgi:CSLREA domain-containing protein
MFHKFKKKLSQMLGAAARGPGRSRTQFRPRMESLEDRLVPALIMVTTTADIVNPNDKVLSLREAINLANSTPGPDTIVLQAGVYKISLAGTDDANASGDFDVTQPLTIIGRGAAATVIDGNNTNINMLNDRIFEVFGSSNMTLSNLTLRDGGDGLFQGGAIEAATANITLNNVTLTGNNAMRGGAIDAGSGNVTLNNCTLSTNNSDGVGGAVFAGQGTVTVNGSTFRGNQGADGGGIFALAGPVNVTNSNFLSNRAFDDTGGAIFASTGNITATGSTFTRNSAIDGGAIDDDSGNVMLVRCTLSNNNAAEDGGAIRVPVGILTLNNSTVHFNIAGQPTDGAPGGLGGGVFAAAANVINSTIDSNTAFSAGGGIYSTVAAILTNSTVNDNQALLFGGGGILAPTASLFNSTVSGNMAFGGVGGGINAVTLNMTNSTVSGNTAAVAGGGGIAAITATLTGSTVSGNVANGSGGGIHTGTVNLTNSTINGNRSLGAIGGGGGIFAGSGTILNSTITQNFAATDGGGILAAIGTSPIHVKNTIIADNLVLTIPDVGEDVSGAFVSDGHNLIGVFNGSDGFGAAGDLLGEVGDPLDPRLGPLAHNGGPTMTQALLAGSPAIDHGDNVGAPTTDQRGVMRPRDGDGNGSRIVDIGAFER